jgi:DNA-binding transcriptional regulator YiaG
MTGPELTHARNQLRLTQSQLAELLCVTLRTIQRYERAPLVPRGIDWALLEIKSRMALASTAKPC